MQIKLCFFPSMMIRGQGLRHKGKDKLLSMTKGWKFKPKYEGLENRTKNKPELFPSKFQSVHKFNYAVLPFFTRRTKLSHCLLVGACKHRKLSPFTTPLSALVINAHHGAKRFSKEFREKASSSQLIIVFLMLPPLTRGKNVNQKRKCAFSRLTLCEIVSAAEC